MRQLLDVLVIESHPGAAAREADALIAAGHRVHRCFAPGADSFPCAGVNGEYRCPVDGPLDAALVVRLEMTPAPTAIEQGVSCAIRAGVPVVASGAELQDPFAPWITRRAGDDVVAACEEVGTSTALCGIAERAAAAMILSAGLAPIPIECALERRGDRLVLHLSTAVPVEEHLRHTLGVRALDAVKAAAPIGYRQIDVQFHQADQPG